MHGSVVFDNNAYKTGRTPTGSRGIIAAEREHGIVALASVAVLQEMLARVRDADVRLRGPEPEPPFASWRPALSR